MAHLAVYAPTLNRRIAALAGAAILASVAAMPATASLAAPPSFGLETTVPVGHAPEAVAVNPRTHTVYVANFGDGTLSVLDGATAQPTHAPIPLGFSPEFLAVDPSTSRVYVGGTGVGSGSLAIVDGADLSKPPVTVTTTNSPNSIAVNPATHLVYITGVSGGLAVSVLDGATGQPVHTPIQMPSFSNPGSLAIDPSNDTIYVADQDLADMWVIDGATDTLNPNLIEGIGTAPQLALDLSTHTVYVASAGANGVSVVPESANKAVAGVNLGLGPGGTAVGADGIAVDPSTHAVYVGDSASKAVSIVNGSDLQAVPIAVPVNLPVNQEPDTSAVAVDPSTHIAYMTDQLDNTLSVIVPFATTVPGAPTVVTASLAGPTSAAVSFTAPASDGGSPITTYIVTAVDRFHPSNGGQTSTLSATGNNQKAGIGGLVAGDAYVFTVAASNAIGTGPASAPSNQVIEPIKNPIGGCHGSQCQ